MRLTFKEGSMASSNASLKSSDFDVECDGNIGCKAVFAIANSIQGILNIMLQLFITGRHCVVE